MKTYVYNPKAVILNGEWIGYGWDWDGPFEENVKMPLFFCEIIPNDSSKTNYPFTLPVQQQWI